MTKYLENPICEFTPLFNIDYTKKKNIISCSFFKMAGGGYKNFTEYSNGILHLSNFIKKEMKDFKLRLFIDMSIYNDKKIMDTLKNNSIEIVLYKCPSYVVDKNKHKGIFGMFARFFPIFDFKNNDAKLVFISDIDFNSYKEVSNFFYKTNGNIINYLIKTKIIYKLHTFIYNNYSLMYISNWLFINKNNYKNNYIHPYVRGGSTYYYKKINYKILLNFFNLVNSSNKIYSAYSKLEKNKKNLIKNDKYLYGSDEYFLNRIYIKYLKKNNLSFGCKIKFDILTNLWVYIIHYKSVFPSKMIKIYKIFFEYIFDNYKFISMKKSIDYIDKKLNLNNLTKNNLTKDKIKLIMNIYIFYIKIYNTKYSQYFNKQFLELIRIPEYIGTIKIDKYKFYNTDVKDIIFENLKLPEKNIKQLKLLIKK
jgi:hypothetical protein